MSVSTRKALQCFRCQKHQHKSIISSGPLKVCESRKQNNCKGNHLSCSEKCPGKISNLCREEEITYLEAKSHICKPGLTYSEIVSGKNSTTHVPPRPANHFTKDQDGRHSGPRFTKNTKNSAGTMIGLATESALEDIRRLSVLVGTEMTKEEVHALSDLLSCCVR